MKRLLRSCLEEHKQLATLGPKDLAARLPAGAVFLDLVRYAHWDKGRSSRDRYLAFVVSAGPKIQRIDLGDAKPIDDAITAWRTRIARTATSLPPAQLRALVWQKIEDALPKDTTTIYLCPDGELTRLPFAALPGRRDGTVLLEDYTLAVVPTGAWLLQQLRAPAPGKGVDNLLVVGDLDYGKAPAAPGYAALPATARETKRVSESFPGVSTASLRGKDATARALRERLPEATVAHLATHGYFDQKALAEEARRAKKQMEAWTLQDRGSERVGLAARNPLGFVGLVLSGGNDPTNAKDGGIVTGLDLLELPLEKLHLCVLSACETGLGEWSENGGLSGLARAFHLAGCRNVVGSLWQVDDAATAALMAQFYHELRVNKRTPLAALREAQLTIYRHPERIPDLAGERGRPALLQSAKLGSQAVKPVAGAKGRVAPTRLWAAFVVSGPGD